MSDALSLSSHVLNLDSGKPVSELAVTLRTDDGETLSQTSTDADGRIKAWPGSTALVPGIYRLEFDTGAWFARQQQRCFYPSVEVRFELTDDQPHYHVPLLLNRFGYSTYRGS